MDNEGLFSCPKCFSVLGMDEKEARCTSCEFKLRGLAIIRAQTTKEEFPIVLSEFLTQMVLDFEEQAKKEAAEQKVKH